jgi:hypothetical protein
VSAVLNQHSAVMVRRIWVEFDQDGTPALIESSTPSNRRTLDVKLVIASVMFEPVVIALVVVTLIMYAFSKFVFVKFAFVKLQPVKSAPLKFTPDKSTPEKSVYVILSKCVNAFRAEPLVLVLKEYPLLIRNPIFGIGTVLFDQREES